MKIRKWFLSGLFIAAYSPCSINFSKLNCFTNNKRNSLLWIYKPTHGPVDNQYYVCIHNTLFKLVWKVINEVTELRIDYNFYLFTEMVSATFGLPSKRNRQHTFHAPRCISSPHDSISAQMAYETHATNVSSAASELDLSRKARPRHLRSRLKLPTNVALASSGEAPLLGPWQGTAPGSAAGTNPPSSNHLNSTSSCYGTER